MADRTTSFSPLRLLDHSSEAQPSDDLSSGVPPLLDEPSLFYDPPYDCPMHDEFAWHLVKYLKRGSGLRYQVQGPSVDRRRHPIDFVVEQGDWRVGFMCGASDEGAAHDRRWDALCVGQAAVDVLYRLRAEDVEQHLHDALLLVGKWDSALFSERGRINLNTLATPEARAACPMPTDTVAIVSYDEDRGTVGTKSLRVQRVSRSHPEGWMPAYKRAREQAGLPSSPPQRWARSA